MWSRFVVVVLGLFALCACSSVKSDGPVPLFLTVGEGPAKSAPLLEKATLENYLKRGNSLEGARVTVIPMTSPFRVYEARAHAFKVGMNEEEFSDLMKDLEKERQSDASCFRFSVGSDSYDGAKLQFWQFHVTDSNGTEPISFAEFSSPESFTSTGVYSTGGYGKIPVSVSSYTTTRYYNYGEGCTKRRIDFSKPVSMQLEARFNMDKKTKTISWKPVANCLLKAPFQDSEPITRTIDSDYCCNTNKSCLAGCRTCATQAE